MTGEHASGGASSRGAPGGGAAATGTPPASVLPVADRPPEVGDVLDGRYRLVDLLGRGGFGDVWRADELLPDGTPFRQVALKLLAPHVTDAASWVEEAKLLASFRHPSLVTIFATGVFHGAWPQPFVAMELLEGATLADVLTERGPIPWRRVLAWAREAAAALDVIHARGVVHLDLKPANLFLCKDGTIKVLDFGIARRATPPAGKGREDGGAGGSGAGEGQGAAASARDVRSSAPRGRGPAGGFETAEAPDSVVLPRSSVPVLSQREAEMSTAVFAAEQGLGVGGQATGGEAAAPAAATSAQSTPEAFAPTFAMGTADVYGATRAAEGTTARAIIGTPGFMAPEIFEQSEPSAATDAYALAVCMAVLATGKLPLDVPDEPEGGWSNPTAVTAWWAAIRNATLRGEMRDLRRGGAGLPAGLVRLLRRLFAVDAAARGVSPGKLCALLDEVWERPHGVPDPAFPGAEPMGTEHEGWLFGRDEEITRLGRDLEHEPCVVLVGPGAAGKTSLALAGLVPHLGKRAVDGKDDWVAAALRDPARGDAALDEALGRVSRGLAGASVEAIVAHCAEASVGLALVVDPLEDAAAASVETRARLGELLSLAGDGHVRPGLRVIGVLSEDEAAVVQGAAFGPALRSSMRYVGPPSPQAASAVVTRPLRLLRADGVGLEPVIAEVQREIAAPGRLPFVAQALADFWAARDRGEGGQGRAALRGERWKELTGVVGAVGRAADRVLDEMSGADRALAEEVLLLFTTTDGAVVKWSEGELLEAFGEEREAADRVLAALVSAGVVRAHEGGLELLHEGLLTGWRRMQKVRASHLLRLAFVERLREAAHAWDKSGKSGEMLLRGALLGDVIANPEWMARGLVGRERDLVAASLRGERRRRAARAGAIAAGVLAIVGLVFGKRAIDAQQARADAEREAAKHQAYVAELVARSRRTEDPFVRVTLVAEAMKEGSTDGLLPIELADNVSNVPRARFLTTDPVVAPSFEWEDRWVIAGATSSTLLIADLRPPEPEVIEDLDLDVDPEKVKRKTFPVPRVHTLRPFEEPIAERVPFAFDTAFATRSTHGDVKVYRLTEEGEIALAAVAPMKCTGAMRTAARAPVLACATEEGLAAWDLRKPAGSAVATHPWKGSVADVSPDGSVVAASADKTLFLWPTKGGRTMEITLTGPVLLARMSPRDRVIAAVTTTAVEVFDVDEAKEALARVEHRVQVAGARWDAGGIDLGLCGRDGGYAWVYLRTGARPADEPGPAGSPCSPAPGKRVPTRVLRAEDLAEYGNLTLGARPALDAFRLPDGRLLTRELVLFDQPRRVARSLLWFDGKGPSGEDELPPPGAAVVNVVRDGDSVAWQVGGEVQVFDVATGKRRFSRPGNLLRRCQDGRLAAWVKTPKAYQVIDARTGAAIGEAPREPLFVLGVDERCSALFTQALDGTITAHALGVSEPPARIAVADGYVYDVRLSGARDGSPGLYLLVSSGAIARIDDATRSVRVLAYATPRATAVADGFAPGEVIFSDGTGVLRLRPSGAIEHVSETDPELAVTDVAAAPDGVSVQFLAGGRLHVIDVARGERRAMNVKNHERMLRWDDEGSLLLWSNDRAGGASGPIVPRAKELALKVAAAASNLTVDRERGVVLKR